MTKIEEKNVRILNRLRELLRSPRTYRAYFRAVDSGGMASNRILDWIDAYTDLRHQPGWKEYCAQHGSHVDHTAHDLFA